MEHNFSGKWITCGEFAELEPRNVFHRQLEPLDLPCTEHRNRHVLFRKKFSIKDFSEAKIYITADDFYKLYVNGKFVNQGPTPAYHFRYNYNVIDLGEYLTDGENTIAVHTLYQGLINRVWQSGDFRHGLILDLEVDGKVILSSDESFKVAIHTAYTECGVCGYDTQILEDYDARVGEVGFERCDYDDSSWEFARELLTNDHILTYQKSAMPIIEKILPDSIVPTNDGVIIDFGKTYVGYLTFVAKGKSGDTITVRCAQELTENGEVRYNLRANCVYEERFILSGGDDLLDWFDYKSFRYAELILPDDTEISSVQLCAKHYPFELRAKLKAEYEQDERLQKIFELCVHSQEFGVQEVIQDCMEREKGFYLGDGCYTALTHALLTGDDSMVRRLIDDAFSSDFISDTLVTCMNCSFMQEIAEYPLILVYLVLWHYKLTGDKEYLSQNYRRVTKLLNAYRRDYEKDLLLRDLDKWCVVEWPANFRHGYDVDIREGQVCRDAHISINAYYIEAVKTANAMARILGFEPYRDCDKLTSKFFDTFYDKEAHLFYDSDSTKHVSLVGNAFAFAFGLFPDEKFSDSFISLYEKHGINSLSMFCTFPTLMGFLRIGRYDLIKSALLDEGAWLRILREGGTSTFEGWGKDTKWNTSLFHLTMSYAAVFMVDKDIESILKY